jgi:hypothetical protein
VGDAGCTVGDNQHDHCGHQLYGLDFIQISNLKDMRILAPVGGKIHLDTTTNECLQIIMDDNNALTICHFSKINVTNGQVITRGKILGIQKGGSNQHIHISIDTFSSSRVPIPFDKQHNHTFEGHNFYPGSLPNHTTVICGGQIVPVSPNEWASSTPITSHNTAI